MENIQWSETKNRQVTEYASQIQQANSDQIHLPYDMFSS